MLGVFWEAEAWENYVEMQINKSFLKRIHKLIKDIQRNGYDCSYGKLEFLKANYSGYASVRIDSEHRLVFNVTDKSVNIISCKSHYNDK